MQRPTALEISKKSLATRSWLGADMRSEDSMSPLSGCSVMRGEYRHQEGARLTSLVLDPATGTANVIFYDRRLDPDNRKTTVTLARSVDGGRTFTNYAWTRDAFVTRRQEFLGDYIGIAALNNKVYGAWAEIPPPTAPKDKTEPPPTSFRPHTVVRVGVADFGNAPH